MSTSDRPMSAKHPPTVTSLRPLTIPHQDACPHPQLPPSPQRQRASPHHVHPQATCCQLATQMAARRAPRPTCEQQRRSSGGFSTAVRDPEARAYPALKIGVTRPSHSCHISPFAGVDCAWPSCWRSRQTGICV
eukprot:350816-Chlamydomonas_euryale.AAC.1